MDPVLKAKLKQLGLKSSRMGGTGSMRMKAKRRRPKKVEEVEEPVPDLEQMSVPPPLESIVEEENGDDLDIPVDVDFECLDQEIQNLENQLEEIKN